LDNKSCVVGFHAVEELLSSDTTVAKVFVNVEADKRKIGVLRQLAKTKDVPLQMVPLHKLNRLTRLKHQGVVALKSPIEFVPLEETVTRLFEEGKPPKIVVADGIQDIRNVGAIARSCTAFGVDLLIIGIKSNAEIGEGAIKSSAGALLKLPVARVPSLSKTLDYLKSWGIKQIAATEKADDLLKSQDLASLDSWALWMGNEDKGISRERLAQMDLKFRIEMMSDTDSLNVSVAAGILLYSLSNR
jgi:23S rRNA (guanosine2251-2'-O)-methyltransferase